MKWPRSVGVRCAAAVRTMDSDHAKFGDRYMKIDASQLRYWVLKAGAEHVDVFRYIITAAKFTWAKAQPETCAASWQQMIDDLAGWLAQFDKPVVVADIGNWCVTDGNS